MENLGYIMTSKPSLVQMNNALDNTTGWDDQAAKG